MLFLLFPLRWIAPASLGLLRRKRTPTFVASEEQGLGPQRRAQRPTVHVANSILTGIPSYLSTALSRIYFGTRLRFYKRIFN